MELWESKDNNVAEPDGADGAAEQVDYSAQTDMTQEAQEELAAGVAETVDEAPGGGTADAVETVQGTPAPGEAAEIVEAGGTEIVEADGTDVSEDVAVPKEQNKFVKGIKKAGKHLWFWIKRHKILTIFLILLIIAALILLNMYNRRKAVAALQTMEVTIETATIETMDLSNSVGVTGTIATAESFTGTTTLDNIEVSEVYVELGDSVEEGDIICTFDSSDLEEALAEAQSNYAINEQLEALEDTAEDIYNETVENAEETLQDYRDSRDDAKDDYTDALEDMDDAADDVDEAEAALETAEAALEEAESALLTATGARTVENINQEEIYNDDDLWALYEAYTEAQTAYQSAQSALTEAEQAYQEAVSAVSQAESAYDQAQSAREDYQEVYEQTLEDAYTTYQKSILQEELTDDDSLLSQIEDYEDQIEDCIVYAGMSGTITSLNVSAGEVFSGGSIYEIQDTEYFIVEATVDEYDIVDIQEGQTAYVVTDATGDEELEAEVTYVAVTGTSGSSMGSVSGTAAYSIEITITEPQTLLRSGMSASVSIALEESLGCLAVPYDCVQTNAEGESVIYAEVDGEQREIVVETGLETDYYTEIISDEIYEGMTVYLSNSMLVSTGVDMTDVTTDSTDSEDSSSILDSITGGGGGDMPSGGGDMGGGGMSGGGMGGGF